MLPPGRYYIGDPCYVFSSEDWDKVIDIKYAGRNDDPLTEFAVDDKRMWCHPTAFGDGEFEGTDGDFYPVDSGTLGAVPIELVVGSIGVEQAETSDFVYVVMDSPWQPTCIDGVFTFDHIEIDTNFNPMLTDDEEDDDDD